MAESCQTVVGIELCAEAIDDAMANAVRNGLTANTRFICASAEDGLEPILNKEAQSAGPQGIVAVLDPPRAGLKPAVCEMLRRCAAVRRVVYVSCNPTGRFTRWDYVVKNGSLTDNISVLCGPKNSELGRPFHFAVARPVDMFPYTPHLELVVVFER